MSNFFITKTSLANKWMRKKIPSCSNSALIKCLLIQKGKMLRSFWTKIVVQAIVWNLSGGAQLRENWLDFHQDPKEEINCPRSYFHRFSHHSKDNPLLEFLRFLSDIWSDKKNIIENMVLLSLKNHLCAFDISN